MNKKLIINLLFLIVLCTLYNCKNIKAFSDQKINYKSQSEPFILKNNQMLITSKINQTIDTLIFDTGASSTTIFNEKLISEGRHISNFKIGAKLPDNSKIYLQEKIYTIENNFIDSDNIVLKTLNIPEPPCNKSKIKNIFGNNVFRNNKKILNIDFEKLNIGILNSQEVENTLKDNSYVEIPIKIKGGIYFIVKEGKFKGEYLIDTGNSGASFITNNESLIDKNTSEIYEGAVFNDASGKSKMVNNTYFNSIEDFPLLQNIKMDITYFESFNGNNLGLAFIKRFNWIIDFENEKAYIKLIDKQNSEKIVLPNYLCNIEEGKLKICTKNVEKTDYTIGEEIISIGEDQITSENICEKMNFLNKTNNWEDLNLKLKSN